MPAVFSLSVLNKKSFMADCYFGMIGKNVGWTARYDRN
jgi:hypothetical protein